MSRHGTSRSKAWSPGRYRTPRRSCTLCALASAIGVRRVACWGEFARRGPHKCDLADSFCPPRAPGQRAGGVSRYRIEDRSRDPRWHTILNAHEREPRASRPTRSRPSSTAGAQSRHRAVTSCCGAWRDSCDSFGNTRGDPERRGSTQSARSASSARPNTEPLPASRTDAAVASRSGVHSSMKKTHSAPWSIALLSAALVACGTSADEGTYRVGCTANGQCATGLCQTGGGFPDGLCTRACRASAECPSGWTCISNAGGICMRSCTTSADCASLSARYVCGEESVEGSSGGRARVCSGP